MENQINNAIEQLFAAMQAKFAEQYPTLEPLEMRVDQGKKYKKLIIRHSVHAFIDPEGNMYKAAGWNQPAKGIRFHIVNDLPKLLQIATYHGGYLYK